MMRKCGWASSTDVDLTWRGGMVPMLKIICLIMIWLVCNCQDGQDRLKSSGRFWRTYLVCNFSTSLYPFMSVCWVLQVCYQDFLYTDTFLPTLKNLIRHRKPATCLTILQALSSSSVWKPCHPSGCWLVRQYWNHGPVGCGQEVSWHLKMGWVSDASNCIFFLNP